MSREPTWPTDELLKRAANRLAGRKEEAASNQKPGITPRTFRYYRTLGLISPPLRLLAKKAVFGTQHLKEVVAVHRLQDANWDLKRIRLALDAAREDPGLLEALAVHGNVDLTSKLLASLEASVRGRLSREMTVDRTGPALERPVVSSTCLAPGVYLVVDRTKSGQLNPKDAYRVGERAAMWLTGDGKESGHDDDDRGGQS